MIRTALCSAFVLACVVGPDAQATSCDSADAQPLPVRSTPVPPLAAGLGGQPLPIASPNPLLAPSRDESLALDVVLLRLRLANCIHDAYAGYKPRTQFDNTPWRYNMEKGRNFTAAEFDAWMKSRGVRIAKGKTDAAPAETSLPAAAAGSTTPVASE